MVETITNESDFNSRLRLEEILAEPEFEELVETAVDTCLSTPDSYAVALKTIEAARADRTYDEQSRRLGLWGIRRHIETVSGMRSLADEANKEEDAEPKDAIQLKMPVNVKVQNKVEAFGQALLEEAFLCLGEDAQKKVEEFNTAHSLQEKFVVGRWLIDRVSEIRDKFDKDDTTEPEGSEQTDLIANADDNTASAQEPFSEYHPLRLSPKLIGRYPDTKVEPTCLGVSLLVASFFEKAGVPYFHAGVAETASESARFAQIWNVEEIEKFYKEKEASLPYEVAQKFKEVHEVNESVLGRVDGYHAAVIANIDGVWVIFDPNFHVYQACSYETKENLDELYTGLDDLSISVRGIDVGVGDMDGYSPMLFTLLYDDLKEASPTIQEIDEWLLKAPEGITIHELLEHFLGLFFDQSNRDVKVINWTLARHYNADSDVSYDHYYIESLKEAFRDKAFKEDEDGTFKSTINRCKVDPQYRLRRAEDLCLLPFLALLRLSSDYGNAIIGERMNISHAETEVGLPAFRIGACVLSDFAVQCGFDLPPGFWLNNWASTVALTEHLPDNDGTKEQVLCARAIANYLSTNRLKYVHSGGIISKFLEQGETQNGI